MLNLTRRAFMATTAAVAFVGPAFAAAPAMDATTETKLKTLLAGDGRSAANKARDAYRHPLETLKFFGLKENMTVLEVAPGGGWWREFLQPLLDSNGGKYVGANFKPDAQPIAPGTADLVLTFRNMHNWMGGGAAKEMFQVMHKSLKPGGYLGIEEHRAPASAPQDPKASMGYVREDYAIQLIESAGFKLVAKSEVNANPKDTKDYPKGVWTLPPTFQEGDKDRAKYAAIGESDRFTLLFQKV